MIIAIALYAAAMFFVHALKKTQRFNAASLLKLLSDIVLTVASIIAIGWLATIGWVIASIVLSNFIDRHMTAQKQSAESLNEELRFQNAKLIVIEESV